VLKDSKLFFNTLSEIETQLKSRNGAIDFYAIIMEAPEDIFYKEITLRTVNSLVEDFENRFLQKPS
jgi:hypothetical protein